MRPNKAARRVLARAGIARTSELERAGVNRTQLRRLVARGEVKRLGRGLYALPDAALSERQDLVAAVRRIPESVVCLLSALRFHGLTTQNPFEVWLAVGHKAWRPKVEHPPVRLVFLSSAPLTEGVEEHRVGGATVRVFSAAKTVADCFKFRNKIGIDVAIEALRDFRRHSRQLDALWRFAKVDRVERVMRPYLESLG